jgi:anti-anti-sigma factor
VAWCAGKEADAVTVLADVNEVRPGDGIVVVEFNGEHDSSTKAERAELLSRLIDGNVHVVVDVSQSQFIDSTFIHNVLVANRLASERGKTFRLQVGTTPIVRRALEVSGILDSVSIAYNREGALA